MRSVAAVLRFGFVSRTAVLLSVGVIFIEACCSRTLVF